MRILALCGSLRPHSATLKALRIAVEGAESAGAKCEILEGDVMDLPLYREMDEEPPPEPVRRLKELAKGADGFLWGSPEYHGICSGVIKNALDWLTTREMSGKPVALVAVAGGRMGAMGTLNSLRISARHVGTWVLPQQVSIASSDGAFDDQDRPFDKKIEERLLSLGRQLVTCAKVFPQLR